MYLGYNTNGLRDHDLFDAVDLLADLGYAGVAVSIDHGVLAPRDACTPGQLQRLANLLRQRGMRSVVETGARFLLDPRHKHEPTLVSPDAEARRRRIAFYRHAIECAAVLGSDCLSLFSGAVRAGAGPEEAWVRLAEGLGEVLDDGAARGVAVALEPEPGMVIDSVDAFATFAARLGRDDLRLTLDVGHLHCQGEGPLEAIAARFAERLVNVHIEDMRRGVHEHLLFGEGEIDFPATIAALAASGYRGGVYVELSRHSHMAPDAARRAIEVLGPLVKGEG